MSTFSSSRSCRPLYGIEIIIPCPVPIFFPCCNKTSLKYHTKDDLVLMCNTCPKSAMSCFQRSYSDKGKRGFVVEGRSEHFRHKGLNIDILKMLATGCMIKSKCRIESNWNPDTKSILSHYPNSGLASWMGIYSFDHFHGFDIDYFDFISKEGFNQRAGTISHL